MKATLALIASQAEVSIATVDRVLNDRPGVKERTRQTVLQVARSVGYFGPNARDEPQVRLDFLLPAGANSFMSLLRKHLMEELETRTDIEGRLHQVESFDEEALAHKLVSLVGSSDGLALVGIDHPQVTEAIDKLVQGGAKVATMVSDVPSARTVGYVGIDNRAAGRLAGYLIGRLLKVSEQATVAVFIGSPSYRGHEEREMGIRAILARDFPHISISSITEINDDREQAYKAAKELLTQNRPDAIYNIGSGNQGIARAMIETNSVDDVLFIGHDLTSATRAMLLEGTMDAVIDQNPRVEAREIVKLLIASVTGSSEAEYPPRLQVVFKENLP
ncbi:MAG: LacI family DNA-binding transcriptional regulator [Hyphomicrobiales bacterium]